MKARQGNLLNNDLMIGLLCALCTFCHFLQIVNQCFYVLLCKDNVIYCIYSPYCVSYVSHKTPILPYKRYIMLLIVLIHIILLSALLYYIKKKGNRFKMISPAYKEKRKNSPGFVVMSSKGDPDPHGSLPLRFRDSCEGSFNSVLFQFLIMSRLF